MSGSKRKLTNDVDTETAKRGVWLVKVPRYLSELWEANEGNVVGHLKIGENVKFHTQPGLNQPPPANEGTSKPGNSSNMAIPTEYSFLLHDIMSQSMALLSENKTGLGSDASVKSGRLAVEGRIMKKAECRPPATHNYMKMKQEHIVRNTQPKKQVMLIEKAAVKFKPVAVHQEDMIRAKQKKDGAKTFRADKDVLTAALFNAFERHQYYRLQDLQQLTQQPASYVKEILQEIAVYNTAPPHKSMWELKPEYRNYQINKDQ